MSTMELRQGVEASGLERRSALDTFLAFFTPRNRIDDHSFL
jgi:hypothetical protein